ncbi:MAG: Ig-like domain-containing protein, partial [Candidatus Pacebacteria bacterium]|nr:Ig-like domain-containing protein [Candidatus Paceibacterota bacterium]
MIKHIFFVTLVFMATTLAGFFYLDFLARAQTISIACTSYTYSNWGTCTADQQSRTILTQSPSGCTDTSTAQLTQSCSGALACTSYTYSAWGTCASGQQSRTILTQYPTDCTDTSTAQLTQPCDSYSPTVTVSAPVSGAVISGISTITTSATDNVGVVKVEFWLGSTNLGIVTSAPYN